MSKAGDGIIGKAKKQLNKKKGSTKPTNSTNVEHKKKDAKSSGSSPSQQANNEKSGQKNIRKLASKLSTKEKELENVSARLAEEKSSKRRLYQSMVSLAQELKEQKTKLALYTRRSAWYDGGIWRSPEILPGVESHREGSLSQPVSLTELFFDLIIVTSFSRVGKEISQTGTLTWCLVAYFSIFWLIWMKESSYSTRFDTSDLSSQIKTLITCFVVLYATLSISNRFDGEPGTRIMMAAAVVGFLNFLSHTRVYFKFKDATYDSAGHLARNYAWFIMIMTFMETFTWCIGIFLLSHTSRRRWVIFLLGILFSLRIPKAFLANDFHAASSKRGVLFILLLGFLLQNISLVAAPFFDYQNPTLEQYAYLGSACFLLFCIKLLYVNDMTSIKPNDHALLVNRMAGFIFQCGQFALLLSTTTLGSGLNLLTHSYLASTAALSDNSRRLVTGSFAAVIASTFLIKSMHIRRVPSNSHQKCLFHFAYILQALVYIAIVALTAYLAFSNNPMFLGLNEMQMLMSLSGLALFAVLMSWIDEGVEMALYSSSTDAENYRVSPFGFFSCCLSDDQEPIVQYEESSLLSPENFGSHSAQIENLDRVQSLDKRQPLLV